MRARRVVSDQNSAELDHLRRNFNNLLRILEGMDASLAASATAENILQQIADAVTAGVDSNPNSIANVVATNVDIEGVKPMPLVPKQVRASLEDSDKNDSW